MIRLSVHFAGHVQGVGFRYTTARIARGFNVAGYVQNLDDGRVLLVVEGEPTDVEGLVSAVEAEMSGFIRGKTVVRSPATGEFGTPGPGRLTIRR